MKVDANGKDLVEFWNWAAQRGEIGGHAARALRSACKEVMTTVEPDSWETVDLRALDVSSFCQRFVRLKAGSNFKPDSLTAYQQRFRRALASYLEYLDAPDKWQYGSEIPSPAKEAGKAKSKSPAATRRSQPKARSGGEKVNPNDPQMLTYPFPVRPWSGLVVNITLPADLTRQEAKRLATFVESLAVDSQPALPAGERQAS